MNQAMGPLIGVRTTFTNRRASIVLTGKAYRYPFYSQWALVRNAWIEAPKRPRFIATMGPRGLFPVPSGDDSQRAGVYEALGMPKARAATERPPDAFLLKDIPHLWVRLSF